MSRMSNTVSRALRDRLPAVADEIARARSIRGMADPQRGPVCGIRSTPGCCSASEASHCDSFAHGSGRTAHARRRWRSGSSAAARTPRPRRERSHWASEVGRRPDQHRDVRDPVAEDVERRCCSGVDAIDYQQRRRLAGRSGDRQDRPGDDAAQRRRQDHGQDRSASARRRAHRPPRAGRGDEQQHLLGGARHQRQHDDRERHRAGEPRLGVRGRRPSGRTRTAR